MTGLGRKFCASGAASYLWNTGDTTQTLLVTNLGTYWVTVTGGTSNCSYTDSITISTPVGITNIIGEDEVLMYPNPATNKLTIVGVESLLNSSTIHVSDIEGRLIEMKTVKGSRGEIQLDLNNFNEGIYFLQIIAGNRVGVKRFTVIR